MKNKIVLTLATIIILIICSIWIYSRKKNKEESNLMLIFTILAVDLIIILPTTINILVRAFSNNLLPDINNTLVYYGTIIGACLTGFITAVGLFFTLNQNAEQLANQRKFDKDAMKEQKELFDKEYNLKLINQKLDTYKEIYLVIEDIINKLVNINHNFIENKYKNHTSNVMRDIESVYETHNKLNFMLIFITEISIIEKYEEAKKQMFKLADITNELYENKISLDQYDEYWSKLHHSYNYLSNELKEVSKNIYIKNINKDIKIKY